MNAGAFSCKRRLTLLPMHYLLLCVTMDMPAPYSPPHALSSPLCHHGYAGTLLSSPCTIFSSVSPWICRHLTLLPMHYLLLCVTMDMPAPYSPPHALSSPLCHHGYAGTLLSSPCTIFSSVSPWIRQHLTLLPMHYLLLCVTVDMPAPYSPPHALSSPLCHRGYASTLLSSPCTIFSSVSPWICLAAMHRKGGWGANWKFPGGKVYTMH